MEVLITGASDCGYWCVSDSGLKGWLLRLFRFAQPCLQELASRLLLPLGSLGRAQPLAELRHYLRGLLEVLLRLSQSVAKVSHSRSRNDAARILSLGEGKGNTTWT
uniref:Uncharacterized protein n=1 Tax=Lotharella globosa TaxID=91324 RepID=A0A7S3Z278_9EUKA